MHDNQILKMPRDYSPGIDTNTGDEKSFEKDPTNALIREIIQNAMDAVLDRTQPVRVAFKKFNLPVTSIPCRKELYDVFKTAFSYWRAEGDNDLSKFFQYVTHLMYYDGGTSNNTACLRVSDFNTKGLENITSERDTFGRLLFDTGRSNNDKSKVGSFGAGKSVSFIASGARTVFYSTENITGERGTIGKVKIANYKDEEGNKYSGKGYICKDTDGFIPMDGCFDFDPDFHRSEPGTDIYIIDYRINTKSQPTKKDFILYVLDNYIVSIFKNKLVVQIGNITVDAGTLDDIMKRYIYSDGFKSTEAKVARRVIEIYETLVHPDLIKKESFIDEDDIEIYIRVADGLAKMPYITRHTGMKVFVKDASNYKSLRADFSAVIVVNGEEANGYFKKLESASHDRWYVVGDPDARENVQKVTVTYVIDAVKSLLKEETGDKVVLEGLVEILPNLYTANTETGEITKVVGDPIGLAGRLEKTDKKVTTERNNKSILKDTPSRYHVDRKGTRNRLVQTVRPESRSAAKTSSAETAGNRTSGSCTATKKARSKKVSAILDGGYESAMMSLGKYGDVIEKKPVEFIDSTLTTDGTSFILDFSSRISYVDNCDLSVAVAGETETYDSDVTVDKAYLDFKRVPTDGNIVHLGKLEKDKPYKLRFSLKNTGLCALEVMYLEK